MASIIDGREIFLGLVVCFPSVRIADIVLHDVVLGAAGWLGEAQALRLELLAPWWVSP
jgi:hypothetical protein